MTNTSESQQGCRISPDSELMRQPLYGSADSTGPPELQGNSRRMQSIPPQAHYSGNAEGFVRSPREGCYRSSRKYASPREAGGWDSRLRLRLTATSTMMVTRYGSI